MGEENVVRLDEFDKEEWWTITRRLRPDWSETQFDAAWDEFCALKRKKSLS